MTVRVLVADDQDLVRTGLSMILDAQPDIEVVAQAADGHAAVELARRLRTARSGPAPEASYSRTPGRSCSSRPCMPPPPAMP